MATPETSPAATDPGHPGAALGRDQVAHLASLARIELTEPERDAIAGQLAAILDAVATVQEVATPDVPATSHPVPLTDVMRDDVPRPSLAPAEALAGAPAAEDDRFRVPRILQED